MININQWLKSFFGISALLIPCRALAGQNLANTVATIHNDIAYMPNVIAGVFYIFGAMLIGAGALKIKAHAENPIQVPLAHGLGRIGAGAVLVALPAFALWMTNSVGLGGVSAVAQSLGAAP